MVPNLSCLFLIFSSNSAFFMTFDELCPNLSARFFNVSKSALEADPIFEFFPPSIPNRSARAIFFESEVRSEVEVEPEPEVAPKRAARAAALSASVIVLMFLGLSSEPEVDDSDFSVSGLAVSVDFGASMAAGLGGL